MPLEKNMVVSKILDYLTSDLKKSVVNDVRPCLNLGHDEGGYFAVPRLILSYVDYLGALYNGYNGKRNERTGKRIFTSGKYAKILLNDIFGRIDPNYVKHNALLWEIYRNGTIHLYSPKILKNVNSSRTIGWIAHKEGRVCQLGSPYNFLSTHLVPHDLGNNRWSQPISIKCLYQDLVSGIDKYALLISSDSKLQSRFVQTADALVDPEDTTLTW
jgi:hypothetical protein